MGFFYRWAREKEEKEGGAAGGGGQAEIPFLYLCAVFFFFLGQGKEEGMGTFWLCTYVFTSGVGGDGGQERSIVVDVTF